MEEQKRIYTDIDSKKFIRSILQYNLESGIRVEFTKSDGTPRTMNCTLNFKVIPTELQPRMIEQSTPVEYDYESDVCVVFDLDKQLWRSFKYTTITKISFTL